MQGQRVVAAARSPADLIVRRPRAFFSNFHLRRKRSSIYVEGFIFIFPFFNEVGDFVFDFFHHPSLRTLSFSMCKSNKKRSERREENSAVGAMRPRVNASASRLPETSGEEEANATRIVKRTAESRSESVDDEELELKFSSYASLTSPTWGAGERFLDFPLFSLCFPPYRCCWRLCGGVGDSWKSRSS